MANKYQYFYLIEIQYLGFRYHGWQIQGKLKTVELMLGKTISYIWPNIWKILAAGRTDALVSAASGYFELFTLEPIDQLKFMADMNVNLPPDISLLSIKEVGAAFNIINDVREKTYQYYFAFGSHKFPLSASLISFFVGDLNISDMVIAAQVFEGSHDFTEFSKDIKEGSKKIRSIKSSCIGINEELVANFFPPESFIFEVKGKGFARHQIRLMMGALVQVGRGELKVDMIQRALRGENSMRTKLLAPASGLMVKEIKY
ncbi:MAG: tRNA pseudouridine38-40 synthase [Marivirga sp.]|jgi:tRNA pseudouridine38-40 synthase